MFLRQFLWSLLIKKWYFDTANKNAVSNKKVKNVYCIISNINRKTYGLL